MTTTLAPTAATPPERSPTSPARRRANSRNAQRSTGPRSSKGKMISRMNALKHGLTATVCVLPTEDAGAFEARRAEWLAAYPSDGPAKQRGVERAVQASWRLDRCTRAETARL